MVRSRLVRLAVAVAACQLLSTTSAQIASLSSRNSFTSATLSPTPASLRSSASRLSSSATASTTSEPQNHKIQVGSGGFKFTPQALYNVSVGDSVTFEFFPPDHSVVQAEFGKACVPYSYADTDHQGKGFWTDLQWVDFTNVSYCMLSYLIGKVGQSCYEVSSSGKPKQASTRSKIFFQQTLATSCSRDLRYFQPCLS